jgi:hypothetical protein
MMSKKNKIQLIEERLVESYRRREIPEPGDNWQAGVMSAVNEHPFPEEPDRELFGRLLWRFSGAAAAVSAAMLVLLISTGVVPELESMMDKLWDPLQSLVIELMGF